MPLLGAFAATFGIFLMPWALAAAAAHLLRRGMQHPLLQSFGRGAAPAVVGLLVVTSRKVSQHGEGVWYGFVLSH